MLIIGNDKPSETTNQQDRQTIGNNELLGTTTQWERQINVNDEPSGTSNHRERRINGNDEAECDVSVSKPLGFETFHFLVVSDSVLKKFGIEKSIGFGIKKIWYRKKVSDSVSFRFWVSSHTGSIAVLVPHQSSKLCSHLLL